MKRLIMAYSRYSGISTGRKSTHRKSAHQLTGEAVLCQMDSVQSDNYYLHWLSIRRSCNMATITKRMWKHPKK